MYEMKITIEAPDLRKAIDKLVAAVSAGQLDKLCKCCTDTATPKGGAANPMETAPAEAAQTTTTVAPTPAQPTAPTVAAQTAPVESYTLEALSRAGAALIDAGKMPQLLALLGKYGVQAVTQLPTEAYSAFAAELKALGAQF